jgi:hypothetical protein
MSPKLILGLAVVTLATTAAAVVAVLERPVRGPVQVGDEIAFPELRDAPEAAARLVIESGEGGEVTLERDGERWVAVERYGYPVATEAVRALLVGLAQMRLIEAKTEVPARYPRLEVEDVDAEGARSRLVRVETADGEPLAETLVGKQRYRLTGTEPGGTYIRRPDEVRSWLASGGLDVETAVTGWVEPEIVDLAPDRIERVEIDPAGAEGYAIVRSGEEADLALAGLGEDESLAADANLARVTGAFRGLELEDVRPTGEVAWPDVVDRVKVATSDGLQLGLRLARIDDEAWLEVVSVTAKPMTDAEQTGEEGAVAESRELAEEIEARTRGWAYLVTSGLYDRLNAPRASWLADDGTS